MYKVLLFGGTVEGRTVAEYLNENKIPSMVCVATEYGESLLPQGEYLELSHERLDEKQMEERMLQMENGLVIDATHPYAQVVTENIETACERTGTAYLRVVRQESRRLEEEETITYVKSIREAVEYLEKTSGNILVTTGSKELSAYTALTDYQSAFSGGSCLFLRKTWHRRETSAVHAGTFFPGNEYRTDPSV